MDTIEERITNQGQLKGRIITEPVRAYEIEGEGFYEFTLAVKRLSDTYDNIPVTISEKLVQAGTVDIGKGKEIAVTGEFRSYNKEVEGKSKLMLHFFVQDKLSEEADTEPSINNLKIIGFICKTPIYRETPFKREICDVLVAINRPIRGGAASKSDYIPCIVWGRNARFIQNLPVGSKIVLEGRIQSREYNKNLGDGKTEVRTAYEVSAQRVWVPEKNILNNGEAEKLDII